MLKNFHAIIFRVKIFSYASRPYENILTTKIFNNENLEHKVAQRTLAENGSRRQIEWNHVFSVTRACWRGVATRQGSLQRGGSILRKESSSIVGLLPARKITARSSYGGRYNRLGLKRLQISCCRLLHMITIDLSIKIFRD